MTILSTTNIPRVINYLLQDLLTQIRPAARQAPGSHVVSAIEAHPACSWSTARIHRNMQRRQ